ncbi:archease [Ignavibacterium sp.]|uniref:archease n=1 Tax=Ignavibacterium sp. TaxID=2651167 RepID=UPI00307FAA28
MSSKHIQLSHTADIAFELEADTLEELFTEAFYVWLLSVVELTDFSPVSSYEVKLKADSLEQLLVDFLNELNYLLHVKKLLSVKVEKLILNETDISLFADVGTIKLNDKIDLKEEIKSVTYHQMEIINNEGKYRAKVVFDI